MSSEEQQNAPPQEEGAQPQEQIPENEGQVQEQQPENVEAGGEPQEQPQEQEEQQPEVNPEQNPEGGEQIQTQEQEEGQPLETGEQEDTQGDVPQNTNEGEVEIRDEPINEGENTQEQNQEGDIVYNQQEMMQAQQEMQMQDAEAYIMPDVIETTVLNEKTQENIVCKIEIIRPIQPKPYLGGLKSIKTNGTYHHSFAQTDQKVKEHQIKYHRETQTYFYSTKSTKVMREFGTQMERTGIWIDPREDKVMQPRMYFTKEMWEQRREEAALFIQRLVRGWFARTITNGLQKEKEEKRDQQIQLEEDFRQKEEVKHKQEIERRMHPRTQDDFDILYDELEIWRLNETEKIKKDTTMTVDQKKIALKQLLNKETELLQTIDRLKINATKLNKEDKIQKFLSSMANPKNWKRSDDRFTEIHTPFTTRAKELMDIYNGLKTTNVPLDERLDILLNTKWTVKEFDYPLTREIVELIDREADMLNRGRTEKSLDGLRKRLCNLFLQFIENPDFNPEASRFQKIPFDLLQKTQNALKDTKVPQ